MSTRADILTALSDHPDGLTLHEIAPLCKACECDEQIVGRTVGMLKSEGVIYPAGMRESVLVYAMGKPPEEELVNEPRIGEPQKPSEGMRVRCDMRRRNDRPYNDRKKEPAIPAMTITKQIEAALRVHGPMTSTQLLQYAKGAKDISASCSDLAARKHLVRLSPGPRNIIYGLPGQTLKQRGEIPVFHEQKPDAIKRGAELGKITPPKGHGPAAQSRSRNGGGGAEAPAVGPALFGTALKALQDERSAVVAQLKKLDRAIEAIEALA